MLIQIHPRPTSTTTPPRRWLGLLVIPGLLLLTAAAVQGQAGNLRQAEPDSELVLTPVSYVFDAARATSVRTLGGKDPAKLPSRGGDKQPTPGWTTIYYETAEGAWPGPWALSDLDAASGADFWGDVSCRSFAGSWSVWCADIGNADCTTYDNNMEAWMVLGPFSLADAVDARAEFRVWSQTEAPGMFDTFSWLASSNGTMFHGFALNSNTTGWDQATFDFTNVPTIGDLRGDPSVWFAFRFESDVSVVMEGTYLDEIVVEKLTVVPVDLVALDVYFRTQPGGGGSIVNSPTTSDVLYPHFDYRLDGDSVAAGNKIWEIELNGSTLCSFTNTMTLTPGSYTGFCNSPVSLAPGMHTLHGEVDPDQTIQESSGGNNDAFRSYTVPVDGGCTPNATTLCIDNPLNPGDRRFRVTMSFQTTQGGGRSGDAQAIPLGSVGITKGGLFAFSDPGNPEVLVKVLNGCNSAAPHWWVFYAPTTNFGFELVVFDTLRNQSVTYFNPDRNVAPSVGDTRALATCP